MDGGIGANLTASVLDFELIPPGAADSIGVDDSTVLRIVGSVSILTQSGVLTSTRAGFGILKTDVGSDQTSNTDWDPIDTDIDSLDNNGVMFWWALAKANGVHGPAADFDQVPVVIPLDIRVKRKMEKRDRLILRARAGAANVSAMSVNLRVLTRTY